MTCSKHGPYGMAHDLTSQTLVCEACEADVLTKLRNWRPIGHAKTIVSEMQEAITMTSDAAREIESLRKTLLALHACIDFDQDWDPPKPCCVENTSAMDSAVKQARPIVRRLLRQAYDNAPTDPHHGGKIWNQN